MIPKNNPLNFYLAKPLFIVLISILLFLTFQSVIFAQTTPSPTVTPTPTGVDPGKTKELESVIKEYESKISELQGQSKTLNSQIELMDNQIALSELRVKDTEAKILQLERDIKFAKNSIDNLETNIADITKAMTERISAAYAVQTISPVEVFLETNNLDNFLTKLKYLQIVQAHDRKMLYAAQQTKNNYEAEKASFEEKQVKAVELGKQLEAYNAQLEVEKNAKKDLLAQTQNDEKKYQNLLASAKAEYEAIQGIIAGKGAETEARHVNEGERIASIIQGSSCNSSGTHLHFMVSSGGASQNPFNYLKSIDHDDSSGGDPFNPSGSWNWPIDTPIHFYQGYGSTWAVKNTWAGQIYSSHNGIDIGTSGSQEVRAVKSGTLYQGSYSGQDGCRLRYVKVEHDEGGVDTFYLHINY